MIFFDLDLEIFLIPRRGVIGIRLAKLGNPHIPPRVGLITGDEFVFSQGTIEFRGDETLSSKSFQLFG